MPPRARKNKADQWMPPRVYPGKSAYEWHPKSGGAVRLCGLDASESEVWREYRVKAGEISVKTCEWLAQEYFSDQQFKKLAKRTQKDYLAYWKKLKPTFGNVLAANVRSDHIRKYMHLRGQTSIAMANKERKLLSILFNYGFNRGELRGNPCDAVAKHPEKGRDRYVTDDEYEEMKALADPLLKVFMEISYTCAARGQDVRKITLNDITEEGVFIEQLKTGKKQVKLWSGRLREAIQEARRLRPSPRVESIYLLITPSGRPYSDWGLVSMWRRARARYKEIHGEYPDWTFHDIKAKGISDYEGDRQEFSGHKSRGMMEKYNRSPDRVKALDFRGKHK